MLRLLDLGSDLIILVLLQTSVFLFSMQKLLELMFFLNLYISVIHKRIHYIVIQFSYNYFNSPYSIMLSYVRKREEKEEKKIFWVAQVLLRESLKSIIGRQPGALIRKLGVRRKQVGPRDDSEQGRCFAGLKGHYMAFRVCKYGPCKLWSLMF